MCNQSNYLMCNLDYVYEQLTAGRDAYIIDYYSNRGGGITHLALVIWLKQRAQWVLAGQLRCGNKVMRLRLNARSLEMLSPKKNTIVSSLGSVHSTCRLVLLSSWHGLSRGVLWRLIYHLLSCSPPYVLSCSMLAALFSCAVFVRSSYLRKKKLVESLVDSGRCIIFALATQKNGSSEVSGEPWVVSKFWRLESCLSASLSRSQVLADRALYIMGVLANAI